MLSTKRIQQNFDRAAAHYDEHATIQQRILEHTYALAKPIIQRGASLLDAGCGTGQLLSLAKEMEWDITPIDLAFGMCKQMDCTRSINADLHALPVATASHDAYLSSLALQWSEQLPEAMCEAARTLRPNGTLIISTLAKGTLDQLSDSFHAAGDSNRMLTFHPAEHYLDALHAADMIIDDVTETAFEQSYDDVLALLHSMRDVGASYPKPDLPALTKRTIQGLEEHYPKKADGRISANWQCLTIIAHKRGAE